MKLRNLFTLDSAPAGVQMEKGYAEEVAFERARERFEWKPFHVRFRAAIAAAKAGQFVLPLASITLGYFFLARTFDSLPPALAGLFAVALLVLVELGKASVLAAALAGLFNKSKSAAGLAVALLFSALSFVLSTEGARTFEAGRTASAALAQVDSVEAANLAEARALLIAAQDDQQRVEGYRAANGWLSSANAQSLALAQDKERRALSLMDDAKTQGRIAREAALVAAEGRGSIAWAVAAGIEAFILGSIFLIVFADFRRLKEREMIAARAERVAINPSDIAKIFEQVWQLSVNASTPASLGSKPAPRVEAPAAKIEAQDAPPAPQVGFNFKAHGQAKAEASTPAESKQTPAKDQQREAELRQAEAGQKQTHPDSGNAQGQDQTQAPPPKLLQSEPDAAYLDKHRQIVELLLARRASIANKPSLVEIAKKTRRSINTVNRVKLVLDSLHP